MNTPHEDHRRACLLADALRTIPGLLLDPDSPHTNMLYLNLEPGLPVDANTLSARLRERGVLVGVVGERRLRLVTHYWIDDESVQMAAQAFRAALTL